jgi:hypothetical protein
MPVPTKWCQLRSRVTRTWPWTPSFYTSNRIPSQHRCEGQWIFFVVLLWWHSGACALKLANHPKASLLFVIFFKIFKKQKSLCRVAAQILFIFHFGKVSHTQKTLLPFSSVKLVRVNQHSHWYLHLLEQGLVVAIFNPRNVKFGLKRPWFSLRMGYLPWLEAT